MYWIRKQKRGVPAKGQDAINYSRVCELDRAVSNTEGMVKGHSQLQTIWRSADKCTVIREVDREEDRKGNCVCFCFQWPGERTVKDALKLKTLIINMSSSLLNFLHFHRRRVAVSCFSVSCYGALCYNALGWKNDLLRLGVAGSLSTVLIETSFHFIDTLNIRTKASEKTITAGKMMSRIWEKEGLKGFGKGFSACFYGSCLVGFI